MSLLSFFHKKPSVSHEEILREARKEAIRYATMRTSRGNVNLMLGRYVTQEQIDAQMKEAAKDIARMEK